MNLEVFNRVNWKESYHSSGRQKNQSCSYGMYSKWASLTNKLYNRTCYGYFEDNSVLCKFSPSIGKQVTVPIVKQLASNLGIAHAAEPSNLTSESEIYWCMEVLCYGLTLPLTEHDTVRDCVNVYCEWLSALHPVPKISVPAPVCKDANFFARKIIAHFLNLFIPRNGEGSDIINKQAVLCHRVLRTLQNVTHVSMSIENETWQTLLLFLLTINDTLLAPPTIKDDVGDQLCERVLSVLLEIWLVACVKCYPPPPLWKTLREMAINWRHRTALIEQWNRINLTLTSRVLEIMYGITFSPLKLGGDEDLQTTINNMTEECVVQTWFRILHTIGNPVDLCHSNIVSQTPQFLQFAITNDNSSEHSCLSVLPLNFYKAIKGIASLVEAFLGTSFYVPLEDNSLFGSCLQSSSHLSSFWTGHSALNISLATEFCSPTPPSRRRSTKSFNVASSKSKDSQRNASLGAKNSVSTTGTNSIPPNSSQQATSSLNYISYISSCNRNALLSPLRPKCNSILHLFGEWLFQASYNSEVPRFVLPSNAGVANYNTAKSISWATGETGSISSGSISSFLLRKASSSQPNSLTTDSSDADSNASTPLANSLSTVSPPFCDKFVCGRAEAVGTLCRIFCAKKTGEEILPIYLSRFYMIIQQNLRVKEYGECDEVMASILLNSVDIFSLDLDGILLLIPYFLEALEVVLPERNLKFNENATLTTINPGSTGLNSGIVAVSSTSISSASISTPISATSGHVVTNTASVSGGTNVIGNLSSSGATIIAGSSAALPFSNSVYSSSTINSSSALQISGSDNYSDSSAFNSACYNQVNADVDNSPGTSVSHSTVMSTVSSNVSINSNLGSGASTSTMMNTATIALAELRKACIHLLLSILPLPLHFQNLSIKEFGSTSCKLNMMGSCLTFGQLKPRLVNLLINALQIEADSSNTHLLLGGLLFLVKDSALCEQSIATNTFSSIDSINDAISNVITSDSAHSLFVRSMHLVCHRLISSWKMDLNVSLAGLEFLTGLARIQIREMDILECKRAVKWLCDFIMYQCWRPPQAHSRDLHSSIVAAFQCASQWLISHPTLLNDKECLNILLEVVELGISGSKSQGKLSEPIRMKDEKELKPVSMRVRDAAEALLTIILEKIADTEMNSISCLLDEVILLKRYSSMTFDTNFDRTYEQAVSKFHYFLFENNVLIALLQEPLGKDQNPQPSITLLIRNCFGRHAWTLQLRHLPRHRSSTKESYGSTVNVTMGRPICMSETNSVPAVHQRYFPDCIDKIETYKADKSIPPLENIIVGSVERKLESLIDQQYLVEMESVADKTESFRECNPPLAHREFYTARMFLCHLGLLSKFRNNSKPNENGSLIALNNQNDDFVRELRLLDKMTVKTCDTCHIFYVKTGQKRHTDILENSMQKSNVSQHFIELLYSLGSPVKVDQHIGWTGHVSTSHKILTESRKNSNEKKSTFEERKDGSCFYDGFEQIIYWSDASSEIAFIVPSLRQQLISRHNVVNLYERSASVGSENTPNVASVPSHNLTEKGRTMSLDIGESEIKPSTGGSVFSKKKSHLVITVMLVWLESFEDHANFPIDELMAYTSTGLDGGNKADAVRDCYIVFLHALQNGLLRVKLQGPVNRINIASPLVDGMIINRRTVGQLVRQTVMNICRRRRLDCDSYQLPHVRRRLKLQEIKDKFECAMNPPELLTYLLKKC